MAITYIDGGEESVQNPSRIQYLDEPAQPEQSTWGAVKAALGSRPELQPLGMPSAPETTNNPAMDAVNAAGNTLALPTRTGATISQGLDMAGDATAEYGPRIGIDPYVAAAAGMAIKNLPGFTGGGEEAASIMRPKVPANRAAAVSAAQELGIPLSRAEQSGSRITAGIETGLEKTPLGAAPINKFRDMQQTAKSAALAKAQEEMGTQSGPFEVGMKAKAGYESEMAKAKELKDNLYTQVPDNVHVPLNKAKTAAQTLLDEQSKFFPGDQDPEVMNWIRKVSNAESSSGKGVTGGPDFHGVTSRTPDEIIPERTIAREHVVEQDVPPNVAYTRGDNGEVAGGPGTSSYYTSEAIPGKTIPGEDVYGAKYSVGPEDTFAPKDNYFALKRMRENLNAAISAAKDGKNFSRYRDLNRLKAGLDGDINDFASTDAGPLESMTAKEFKRTYNQANAYNSGYKDTYENPDALDLGKSTSPEHIVEGIFKKNSESDIRRFRAAVGEEAFGLAKKRFTQDLLESKNIKNELGKYGQGTLSAIYSPSEIEKLTKLGDAFNLIQGAEKTSGNPSGTGRILTGAGSYGAAGYALKAGKPGAALAILGIPYLAANEYVGTSAGIPISAATQRLARGTAVAAGQQARPRK